MKTLIKWIIILLVIFAGIILAAGLILPRVVDVNSYKERIEQMVTEKTGCSFSLGKDVKISVFPWLGLQMSEVRISSPDGFDSGDMVYAKNFEVRVKLLPLFSGNVKINTFALDSPRIFLEKSKDGRANWQEIGQIDTGISKDHQSVQEAPQQTDRASGHVETKDSRKGKFPISSLMVEHFSITDGSIQMVDKQAGTMKELTDLNLSLSNISLDKPIHMELAMRFDQMPLSLKGTAGPLGNPPGSQKMEMDVQIKALDMIHCRMAGRLSDLSGAYKFHGTINVAEFSPRKLVQALKMDFPIQTADSGVLEKFAFTGDVDSVPDSVGLSNAIVKIDDTTIKLAAGVTDFARPNVKARIHINKMDVERYLPPVSEEKQTEKTDNTAQDSGTGPVISQDSELRRMTLDVQVDTGALKIANIAIDKSRLVLLGKSGVFTIKPLELDLYQGKLSVSARADLTASPVQTSIQAEGKKIQVNQLLQDAAGLNILEGTLESRINLSANGLSSDDILKTAKGKGRLLFTDGAIVGIDLAGMARNASSILKGKQQSGPAPRTDFSEVSLPFSLAREVVTIHDARLQSPFIRLLANGTAHVSDQTLDLRIAPKFVGTIKGQGDTQEHSGVLVPLKVTGSFSNPKIRPDMTKTIQKALSDPEQFKKDAKSMERRGRHLLKKMF